MHTIDNVPPGMRAWPWMAAYRQVHPGVRERPAP